MSTGKPNRSPQRQNLVELIQFKPATLRLRVLACLTVFGAATGAYTLGLEGAVFGLLYAGQSLRFSMSMRAAPLHLKEWGSPRYQIRQVWMLDRALCVTALTSGSPMWPYKADSVRVQEWFFKDEFSPSDWAALRRVAIAQCPSEPVGLSISR